MKQAKDCKKNVVTDENFYRVAGGGLTRRSFLQGAFTGTVGVVAAGAIAGCSPTQKENDVLAESGDPTKGQPTFMVAPAPISEDQISSRISTDVLVIGAGIAGAATASSCVENGLQVVLIDKLDQPRYIGIDFGFVNPTYMQDWGIEKVDPYVLARDFIEKSANRVKGDVVYRFMTKSGEAGDWFIDKAKAWGFEPYPQAYRGNSDFYQNYVYVTRLYDESAALPTEGAYENMRISLEKLAQEVVDAGGQFLTQMTARQLIKEDDGRIVGAICEDAEGNYVRIDAERGTVLATGDYGADEEMFSTYIPWPLEDFDMMESTNTGDGHKMGLWVGAAMQAAPHPAMLFHDSHAYHYLRVNKYGQRYVNEDAGYSGTCVAQLMQPDHASWAIYDSKWPQELPQSVAYGGGMGWDQDGRNLGDPWIAEVEEADVFAYEKEEGRWFEADTLDELANQMGFEGEAKENFLTTVSRYNELVEKGVDEDFGKRPELMALSAITEPPFIAVAMVTDLGVTAGGLLTDVDSQVLDEEGRKIPGLYGVGTVTGSMFAVDYNETTVPGVSIARNVTFGWLLGKHLAES